MKYCRYGWLAAWRWAFSALGPKTRSVIQSNHAGFVCGRSGPTTSRTGAVGAGALEGAKENKRKHVTHKGEASDRATHHQSEPGRIISRDCRDRVRARWRVFNFPARILSWVGVDPCNLARRRRRNPVGLGVGRWWARQVSGERDLRDGYGRADLALLSRSGSSLRFVPPPLMGLSSAPVAGRGPALIYRLWLRSGSSGSFGIVMADWHFPCHIWRVHRIGSELLS